MSENEFTIRLEQIPEPQTDEMVTLLHQIMGGTLSSLPFRFTTGDVMTVATEILVEAGMVAVMEGRRTSEQLAEEICGVIRARCQNFNPAESNVLYRNGITTQ